MSDRGAAWGSDFRHLLIFACLAALFKESDGWWEFFVVVILGSCSAPSVAAAARRVFCGLKTLRSLRKMVSHE